MQERTVPRYGPPRLSGTRATSVSVRAAGDRSQTLVWSDLTITDNGKYGFCTRTTPPFVCVELNIAEIAP
jgi:hypothetical protein